MPRKTMVHLYYAYAHTCREDCDTLGIDRRRVISLGTGGHETMVFHDGHGQQYIEPVHKRMVAKLIVSEELVERHLENLQHDDDETWS